MENNPSSETVQELKSRERKILVPVDFSKSSLNALAVAKKFAKMHGSEIILFNVAETSTAFGDWFGESNLVEKEKKHAEEKLQKLEDEITQEGIKVSRAIMEGRPYKEIVKMAAGMKVEMVVQGTTGKDNQDTGFLGSNIHNVIRTCPCPVLSVGGYSEDNKLSKVLVPVDPEFGIRELRFLFEYFSKVYNPEITLVSVSTAKGDSEKVNRYLNKQKDVLMENGLSNVKTKLIEGDIISQAIVDFAIAENFEMIWMETHGRKGIGSFIVGSITEEVIFYSPVPVLSLKPIRLVPANTFYHEQLPI